MKKLGFTIIELLTVIVVLAIISLIITPVVLGLIRDAREGTARNSAYGLIDAARTYYALEMKDKGVEDTISIEFPDDEDMLEYGGTTPKTGVLEIDKDGRTRLAIVVSNHCVTKTFSTDKVKLSTDTSQCELP